MTNDEFPNDERNPNLEWRNRPVAHVTPSSSDLLHSSLSVSMSSPASLCETCHTPLEKRGSGVFCPACVLRELMDEPDVEAETEITPAPAAGDMPRVPRHSMIEKIGEGGFANVYRAMQREPVRREVAIKVLKPQIASYHVLARFETERQTLARMEHPGIARLWDSGVTMHGQPFFAMELVRGEPVTAYCEKNHLMLDERLQIFCSICDAVQHAHEKGVLHRDLKPSNILVAGAGSERVVKIIDFGIAKALELSPDAAEDHETGAMTSIHQAVGTPGYMSPEQSAWGAHHVDARSDLYALGVVLYELLTGSTPLQIERKANDEARQWPVAKHIKPPSHLPRTILLTKTEKRDLDAIALKALEMDSTRRYASAAAFADDIQRHLHDEPVLAGERSWTYVMEKFTRRHLPFVVSAGVAGLAVVGGFTASTVLYFKEQKARSHAEDRQLVIEAREAELRRTLSRADHASAQQFKNTGDAQSAVACLVRALRQDPAFKAAAADLQMMLLQDDTPQPVETVIPVDPAWGEVQENMGAVSAGGHVLASVFLKDGRQRVMLFRHAEDVWNRRELPLTSTLEALEALEVSSSGNLLVLAEQGGQVRLLRPEDPMFEKKWTPPAKVTALTTTTVSETVAVGCADGSIWMLGAAEEQPPVCVGEVSGAVTRLLIQAQERLIVAGSREGEVRRLAMLNPADQRLLIIMPGEVTALSTSGNGMLAVGDSLGNVACFTRQTETLPVTHLHDSAITAVTLTNGRGNPMMLTAGGALDLRVKWFDLNNRVEMKTPVESAGAVRHIAMTRSGECAVIVNADASVRMWRQAGEGAITVRKPQRARFIAMSTQGRAMAVRRDHGRGLEVLTLPQDTIYGIVLDHGITLDHDDLPEPPGPACAAFCADGVTLVESNELGVAALWDSAKAGLLDSRRWGQPAMAMGRGAGDSIRALMVDGSLIEVPMDGGALRTLVPASKAHAWTLAAISPDGRGAAWATSSPDLQEQCHLRVWWEGEKEVREMTAERLSAIALHAGTRRVALGLGNGHVRVIHSKADPRGVAVPLHQSAIKSLAFSPDGNALLTGSSDHTVAIWKARSLAPLMDPLRLDDVVERVVFSGDGRRFACGTQQQVIVGDFEAKGRLGEAFALPNIGRALTLNHDGTRVAFSIGNGSTFVHDIAPVPSSPVPEWFLKLAETYVSRRMTAQGTVELQEHPGREALQEIVPEGSKDEWSRFAGWMFSHTGLRTITPWSPMTLEAYLAQVDKRLNATRSIELRRWRGLQYHEREAGGRAAQPVP
jgi:WD40 repeat protein/tRNA A-37 threonylcarbamoyl transferase component Bud32